jgi:tetraacyldisaccharide 4'-kinase
MKSLFLNKVLLFPYYIALKIRHYMYDKGVFKSYKFDIPIISVGNISAGGTGKTPHTEFIVKELMQYRQVAVLSRGYGRKSRGFHFVSCDGGAAEFGDEPLQIKRKFPEVTVAVDGNRVRGVNRLMNLPQEERPDVIILDDAFQHRRVVPGLSILLIDYSRPPESDNLLPFGGLRDLPEQMKRADAVVITKSPCGISDEERFYWKNLLRLLPGQRLFFSALEYCEPLPIFEEADKRYIYSNFVILITGIANPRPLEYHLLNRYKIVKRLRYRDHHSFGKYDALTIGRVARRYPKAVIFTTEKDSQRLMQLERLNSDVRKRIFVLPIEVMIINQNGLLFSEMLRESLS